MQKKNALAMLSIFSYFVLVIPLGFVITRGIHSYVINHKKHNHSKASDNVVNQIATQSLNVSSEDSKKILPASNTQTQSKPLPPSIINNTSQSPKNTKVIQEPANIPAHLDIRGNKWLTNIQLWQYIKYLSDKHPQLSLPNLSTFVIKKNSPDAYPISEAVVRDMAKTDKTIFAYPLHVTRNHWTLVLVDRNKRTVEFYDSKATYGNHQEICSHLTQLAHTLSQKESDGTAYRFVKKIDVNLQPDSYQCGPWSLYFLEERLKNADRNFNELNTQHVAAQSMIANYRLDIMNTLISEAAKPRRRNQNPT